MIRPTTRRTIALAGLILAGTYLMLLIPAGDPDELAGDVAEKARRAFAWNQDAFWSQLEERFVQARARGCDAVRPVIDSLLALGRKDLANIERSTLLADDAKLSRLETLVFDIGSIAAVCPERVSSFDGFLEEMRAAVKRQSERWDMSSGSAREGLYRLLYGGRATLEEVLLQLPDGSTESALSRGTDEPSETPSATMLGVNVHSGDILVSRGGAPTSALIARGNDFPGNFSHVAMAYVDPQTRRMSIIESHIERGVTVSTLDEYLKDTKLRVMILRPRHELPQVQADPLLPHRAAALALKLAGERHIPYDFAMDFRSADKWFCSEAASVAYESVGLRLWMGLSYVSSPGLRAWLASFGVRHFETQEPSDLEYDPQLRIVAEWRSPDQLRKDHLDNAVTEAMLEGAEAGDRLGYAWYMLPIGRIGKAYSVLLNWFGGIGPVPEGMSAQAALRNKYYSGRHEQIVKELTDLAEKFNREKGYAAPYWRLLQMARQAKRAAEHS